MKISSSLYFSCWSLISLGCLALGLKFLNHEKSSVSPMVLMVFLKLFLAFFVFHSSNFALLFFNNIDERYTSYIGITSLLLVYPYIFYMFFGPFPSWPVFCTAVFVSAVTLWCMGQSCYEYAVEFFVRVMMFAIGDGEYFLMLLPLLIAFSTNYNLMQVRLDEVIEIYRGNDVFEAILDCVITRFVLRALKWHKKPTVRFAVAMFFSILFQQFVKFTSFHHVLAFLLFAGAWIGCLALLMSPTDFGVFDFLLSNILVGCTINEFELRGATWFAYFATIVLYFLRQKLATVHYVHQEGVVEISGPAHGS